MLESKLVGCMVKGKLECHALRDTVNKSQRNCGSKYQTFSRRYCKIFLYSSLVFQIQSFVQLRYIVCDVGYVGDDCSLATDAVPVISSFRRGCTCDVRRFSCGRVFIAAADIYNSDTLTCRVQSTKSRVSNTRRRIRTVNMPCEVSSQRIQAAM